MISETGEQISIPVQNFSLQGILDRKPGDSAVLIAHPHPLYGGDMYNNVVGIIAEAFLSKNITTLRFNFRGVGQSQGNYDEGRGEREDILAARNFLLNLNKNKIILAGYSFGAWVMANALEKAGNTPLIMVAPPVALLNFSDRPIPNLIKIITGTHDQFGPLKQVTEKAKIWNPSLKVDVINGADHFFWGKEQDIFSLLATLPE